MKSFNQLDEVSIVTSPEGVLEAILQRFRTTDQYQSKIFPVASLQGLIATANSSDAALIDAVQTALGGVIAAYFEEGFDLDISLRETDGESELMISIDVVTDEGTVSAAWALQVIEGQTGDMRRVNGTESSYDI